VSASSGWSIRLPGGLFKATIHNPPDSPCRFQVPLSCARVHVPRESQEQGILHEPLTRNMVAARQGRRGQEQCARPGIPACATVTGCRAWTLVIRGRRNRGAASHRR
jgi:hypothetical protein